LKTGKNGIGDQDCETDRLKREFGIFPPLSGLVMGRIVAVWGLWRLRRCRTGRQMWLGSSALLCGFVTAVVCGVVFLLVVT
jgi:hypothetical protein